MMSQETRRFREILTEGVEESILQQDIFSKEHRSCYVGFESSGSLHLGHIGILLKIRDLQKIGFKTKFLISSFHGELNQKKEIDKQGIVDVIKNCSFLEDEKTEIICSSSLITKEYLLEGIKIFGKISLRNLKKSLTITGRKEDGYENNPALLLYPIYQMLDIKILDVDLCVSGMDQRNVHILFNEKHSLFNRRKTSMIHLPMLPSLESPIKMSKSLGNLIKLKKTSMQDLVKKFKKCFFDYKKFESPFFETILIYLNLYNGTKREFKDMCQSFGPEKTKDILIGEIHKLLENF